MSEADLTRDQILMIQRNMQKYTYEFNQRVAALGYEEAIKQLKFNQANIFLLALDFQFAIKFEKARKKTLESSIQLQFFVKKKLEEALKVIANKRNAVTNKLAALEKDKKLYAEQKAEEARLIAEREEQIRLAKEQAETEAEAERIAQEKAAKKKKVMAGGAIAAAAAAYFMLKE